MDTMETNLSPQKKSCYDCVECDYHTSSSKDFNKHISTNKHKTRIFGIQQKILETKIAESRCHVCNTCGKEYKTNSGLWKHNKICDKENPQKSPNSESDKEIIKLLIKENAEFKNLILEIINKDKSSVTNNNNNITNNTNNTNSNNTFNLQFFLNEQCKDAINIDEFVENIKIQLNDLETTGRVGYVEGVSRIINKNLNGLDKFKRPIHCSDIKREILYIKNNNEWKKDDTEKQMLTKAIKQVACKSIGQIGEWKKENPDCADSESKKNDLYLKIISNSMSGMTTEEQSKNYEKIITNVAKEVIIEK
jgi:hypothetical protein